ncbi:arylesterase [Xinfangfangia sp. CPCC 101601]|uniref:Arylesterase n=1 Tax=Pseudogemmobacter lacusdianii TaxID=3069608 RepID=A0ABU0VW35_9RHOB|nr:arylesterase [Xinfangfangia sp. CPCC 101601]MDQ2065960.1 arylesterase [Xinfangfangia sp. CPCC 101601]
MKSFLQGSVKLAYGAISAARNVTSALVLTLGVACGGAVAAEPVTVVALGDSLTAGYGLAPDQGLVPRLQAWAAEQGVELVLQNAGVSGDTTAGGLSRVDWALGPDAQAVMVTLGGNDMLRGVTPSQVRANLDGILSVARGKGLPVLLVAMQAPPNFGAAYKAEFDAIYPELAAKHGALLAPDFFAGFVAAGASMAEPASYAKWMQSDGIHPNAEGVALVVQGLGPKLLELVAAVQAAP